jgi:hypothetical protein
MLLLLLEIEPSCLKLLNDVSSIGPQFFYGGTQFMLDGFGT